MQLDMHFYAVYAMARAAGLKAETAGIVATASQFVDDAVEDKAVVLEDRALLPVVTSHAPIDYQNTVPSDQWNVWAAFHFLPGGGPDGSAFPDRMACAAGSPVAEAVMEFAIEAGGGAFGPHLLGIAAHAYADTYSHHGFVGLCHERNRVDQDSIRVTGRHSTSIREYLSSKLEQFGQRIAGTAAEVLPVGHGSVGTYPDRPFLEWEFNYEKGSAVSRDNPADYLKGCEALHRHFSEYGRRHGAHFDGAAERPWAALAKPVEDLLRLEAPLGDRSRAWARAIASGRLFPTSPADGALAYFPKDWCLARVISDYAGDRTLASCEAYRFIEAARVYRTYVLQELLPKQGLVL